MHLIFDQPADRPAYKSGVLYLENMIKAGRLESGSRLPSVRVFSADNGISTATAQRIYSELEREGLITTIKGSGSQVTYYKEPETESSTNRVTVFWSYAHRDDQNSKGAVLTLLDSIKAEYELQTGSELTVFLDKDSIEWGARWKEVINDALLNTVIFIPVLTPTYLKRPSCLGELRSAFTLFRERGMSCSVFPIRFTNIDNALRYFPDDDLANALLETQAENYYELNTRDPDSAAYQDYVARLVSRLIDVDKSLCEGHSELVKHACAAIHDAQNGYLDNLASLEEEGARQANILNSMTQGMAAIGQLAQEKTAEVLESNAKNGGFSGRLLVIRRMAEELTPLADKFYDDCRDFTRSVDVMGEGVNAYVEICQYYRGKRSSSFEETLETLITNSTDAFARCKDFLKSIAIIGKMSRDLREPVNKIQKSLDLFCSTQTQFSKWGESLNNLDKNSN